MQPCRIPLARLLLHLFTIPPSLPILKWIWGTLQGEWNDNPTTAQVVVDTIITLIPIADQIGDARDISAYLYKFLYEKRYDEVLLWVGFVFTLIGVVPEAGSAAKGTSRVLIKLLKEDSDEAFELLAKLGKNELKHLDTIIRKMDASRLLLKESAVKVLDRADGAIGKLREGIKEAEKLPDWADMGAKLKQLDSMLSKMHDTLQEVRKIAPEKIDEGITYLGRRWGPIAARLGIRGELQSGRKFKGTYSESYLKKLVEVDELFKAEGYELTEHALNNIIGRVNQGRISSYFEIIETLKTGTIYREANGNLVRFRPGISVHINSEGLIESVVPRKNPVATWELLE